MGFAGRAYLVCCDARTGSSLLAGTLRSTGRAGRPYEYFSRAEIEKPWLRNDLLRVPADVPFTGFAGWRDYILRSGSELGGVFAASVHYWQFGDCVDAFREDPAARPLDALRAFFPQLRLVRLRRRNVVAQAISHHVAISTNYWNSRMAVGKAAPGESDRDAPYDFDRIDHQVTSALAVEQGWSEALRGAEAITLPLAYEELAADIQGAVRRLCAHVGIELGDAPIAPGIEKQAGAWSLEMERRYRRERQERGLGPVGDEAAL